MLVPQALAKLEPSRSYKICTKKDCVVVYFNEKKEVFLKTELKVKVYTKSDDEVLAISLFWTEKVKINWTDTLVSPSVKHNVALGQRLKFYRNLY